MRAQFESKTIIVWKTQWKELQAAVHNTTTTKMQRVKEARAQLAFSILRRSRTTHRAWSCPQVKGFSNINSPNKDNPSQTFTEANFNLDNLTSMCTYTCMYMYVISSSTSIIYHFLEEHELKSSRNIEILKYITCKYGPFTNRPPGFILFGCNFLHICLGSFPFQ